MTFKDLNLLPSLFKSDEGQTNKRTSFQEPWQVGKMLPSRSKTKLCKKCLYDHSAPWMSQRPSEIKRPSKLQRSSNPFKMTALRLPETSLTPSTVLNCQCNSQKLCPKSQSLALITLESISRPRSLNSFLKQQLFSTEWRVSAAMCLATCREDCLTRIAKLKKLDCLPRHQLLDMGYLDRVKRETGLNRLRLQENILPLLNSLQGLLFLMQRSAKFSFIRVWMRCSTNANLLKQEPLWSRKTKRRSDVWTEQTCAICTLTTLLEKGSNQCMFHSYLNKFKTATGLRCKSHPSWVLLTTQRG